MPLAILALIVFLGAALVKLIGGHGALVLWLIIVGGILVSLAALAGDWRPWRHP
jgi:hypothetical protein